VGEVVRITVDGKTSPKIKRGKEDREAEKEGQETMDKPVALSLSQYNW